MKGSASGRASPQTEGVCFSTREGEALSWSISGSIGPTAERRGVRSDAGVIVGEGAVPADADGLARLVIERGTDVRAVVEMMSGAIWVRDELTAAGWRGQIAHAPQGGDVAPPGFKNHKGDAPGPAEAAPPRPGAR